MFYNIIIQYIISYHDVYLWYYLTSLLLQPCAGEAAIDN